MFNLKLSTHTLIVQLLPLTLLIAPSAFAQVTSVSQLSDVQPTDWAFQALQALVSRYGCIAGYPDGTYRGNRALTRYEFAAGLNACLDKVLENIDSEGGLNPEDLATLRRLQDEFKGELATLRGRVDALEARTAELEANQFSTTTKLQGEAIFALLAGFGSEGTEQAVFQDRVRLNLNTSFTGKDVLITRLQAGNGIPINPGSTNNDISIGASAEAVQASQVFSQGNDIVLDTLAYKFPVGDKLTVTLAANRAQFDDFTPTVNPFFEDFDGGSGALSAFAQRNPIYRLGGGGGIGLNYNFSDAIQLTAGYLATDGPNPTNGNGLFNGDYSALAQLTLSPSENLIFALTYNHGYFGEGSFGFDNGAKAGGFTGTRLVNGLGATNPISSNSYGVELAWQVADGFQVNAWGAFTDVELRNIELDGEIWNWALGLAFPDLGKPGNLAGLVAGVQPYLGGLEDNQSFFKNDIPVHLEGFYKIQVSDYISVTPGFVWLLNPNQDRNNEQVVIGTLRTTFEF
jgi:Carbohydrate-selective porin, OprB family/S-layer homology domain